MDLIGSHADQFCDLAAQDGFPVVHLLEMTMDTVAKKMLIRVLAITALVAGAIGTAIAGYWTYDAYGIPVDGPTCYSQFVRTGPFTGFWTRVCE